MHIDDSDIKIDGAISRKSPYGLAYEPTFAGVLSFMRRSYSKNPKAPIWSSAACRSILP